jgi:hypothetical protein
LDCCMASRHFPQRLPEDTHFRHLQGRLWVTKGPHLKMETYRVCETSCPLVRVHEPSDSDAQSLDSSRLVDPFVSRLPSRASCAVRIDISNERNSYSPVAGSCAYSAVHLRSSFGLTRLARAGVGIPCCSPSPSHAGVAVRACGGEPRSTGSRCLQPIASGEAVAERKLRLLLYWVSLSSAYGLWHAAVCSVTWTPVSSCKGYTHNSQFSASLPVQVPLVARARRRVCSTWG